MKFGTSGLESSTTQIQPIDGNAFEPPNSTDKQAIQMLKPDKGTTYLGFIFMEGVILASYSHMSPGTSLAPKIVEINSHTLSTVVGGAADELFRKECQQLELQNNRRMSAELASECLEMILSNYSDGAAALVAGWEPQMGPLLFLVDNDDEGCLSGFRFCIRSGSYKIFEALEVRNRYNMSIFEAASFARWAIHLAASEEGARGGVASVYYVGPNGWKKMFGDDVVRRYCYPVSRNTGDQEMAEEEMADQEMAEARTLPEQICSSSTNLQPVICSTLY